MIPISIDLETTGLQHNYHEVVEIGAVILDRKFRPTDIHFKSYIKPMRPETTDPKAFEVNGLDLDYLVDYAPHPWQVKSAFNTWCSELYLGEKFYPMSHNAPFDKMFCIEFFGPDMYNNLFHYKTRDSQAVAQVAIDLGLIDCDSSSLNALCDYFGIKRKKAHTALEDAKACAEVYHKICCLIKPDFSSSSF